MNIAVRKSVCADALISDIHRCFQKISDPRKLVRTASISFTDVLIPNLRKKFTNLTRRQHKFLCLERATIADRQGASEDLKFVAKPTQSNMNLFFGLVLVPENFLL